MSKHSVSMLGLLEARNDARAAHRLALAARDAIALRQSGPRYASALRALDEAGALWPDTSSRRYEAALSNEDRAAIAEFLEECKRLRLKREKAEREQERLSRRDQKAESGRAVKRDE